MQLPGKWKGTICNATAQTPTWELGPNRGGRRDNPPIIEVRAEPGAACYYLDDADGGRGGNILLKSAGFDLTKC